MLDALFAWSWDGHGRLTTLAVAAAINQLVWLGKSDLMRRIVRLCGVKIMVAGLPRESSGSHLYSNIEKDPLPTEDSTRDSLKALLMPLPSTVQMTDLHAGNIPVVGEYLDSNGQVRHFMRSTKKTEQIDAYTNSMGWIRNHVTEGRNQLQDALYKDYGYFTFSNNIGDLNDGLTALAEGLHTVEDSYAPGHVRRSANLHNIIQAINYWDDDNKKPHNGWPGHEALDNPENPISAPYFASATTTTTEIIVCVLSSLGNSDASTFSKSLGKILEARFMLALGSRDVDNQLPGDGIPA
jgi:hypothetical protein